MPGELDELRKRQELFERRQDLFDGRLGILELTAEAKATERAVMEQDIADVKAEQRAQRSLLQAIGKTQSEHTARFATIEGRLGNVEGRLDGVETRLGMVEGRLGDVEQTLGNVHIGVQAILAVLDRKIDEEDSGG